MLGRNENMSAINHVTVATGTDESSIEQPSYGKSLPIYDYNQS